MFTCFFQNIMTDKVIPYREEAMVCRSFCLEKFPDERSQSFPLDELAQESDLSHLDPATIQFSLRYDLVQFEIDQ